jgi:hypothetical protein
MTRQSPYAWPPRPSHGPQHAAAVSGKAELRSRAHRAMKLFLIASVWVTGLFVVIVAVTVVAMASGPSASRSGPASLPKRTANGQLAGDAVASGPPRTGDHDQVGQIRAGHGQAAGNQTGGSRTGPSEGQQGGPARTGSSAPAQIHAVYIHTGSADTSSFTIGGNGTWKLAWSYHQCPGGGFTVSQDGTGRANGPSVIRPGTAGHGVTWAHNDGGTHYLAIRTQCRWRITVTSQS